MTKLSVNINKIALLRNARDLNLPSVIWAAETSIKAGAYGITVHPRPDERHIRYSDVYELVDVVQAANVEYNIEGNPLEGRFMEIMPDIKPNQATLVPDTINASTSNQGWDLTVAQNREKLLPIIEKLKSLDIRVSIFIDHIPEMAVLAAKIGADRVELYTEPYATAFARNDGLEDMIAKFAETAKEANRVGLGVNAGHDLNLENLGLFCDKVENVLEVSIGHALTADALKMGMEQSVKEYLKILNQ